MKDFFFSPWFPMAALVLALLAIIYFALVVLLSTRKEKDL